ncbi:hypothetical protein LAZ67_6001150 [Cordylochernes scorpioides]|uniref:RNA-directed DNA polymerase n=1 Tax=Cordylochernes scorpioides TaxID=51811 RepID=A0ABY6KK29_9ARAC|nr:hypothetical protein LAZ67_6001150 [Cordylochernes scorpioides]
MEVPRMLCEWMLSCAVGPMAVRVGPYRREGTEPDDPNPTSLLSMGQQTAVSTQKCSDVCLENVGRRMSVFRVLSSEPPPKWFWHVYPTVEEPRLIELSVYGVKFAKQLLETLIEDRERIEERERIEDRKRIEDRERIERERKEQMVMEFELEKLRIQTTRGNNDTSRSTSNDAHYEIRKLMPKYESKDNDLSFYLILFERQAKRLGLDEDQWAFSLLGLLPYEMTQLIARETEEQSGDYRFVKRLLLKRYKLSPEQFRQKFEKHERSQKGSWRDFAFELRGYFNEWIEGMNVENFDALKDLSVTNQLKKKVQNVLRNHLIDDWTKLNNPDELADKLDEYENVRTEMGPPHWNAKHLIPPSFQQKSARFPNQSEVKETKQGTNVSGQDAARNEISETYPNTLRRMVNRTIRNDKGEPKCFNCNQFGHIARDCPAPRTTLTCRGCGQTGHKERNCTRPKEGLKVANLEVEGLETVPPDVYLKDVKIDNKETVKAMIDTGSSSCLMRESVARRISVDIEPDSTSLYGIGNQTAPAARTVGKTTVDLEIDGIVGREITVFIVNDDAQPYDLLIGRTWTDLPYVSFARIGKNLHIGYSSEFPFANLQEEIKSRRIELRATETVQLESDSINFTSAITDEVKDGYVLFTGVDDACVDSLLEVVDGKTTVPIISAGKGKLRVRKNQCVGRVELLNLDDIVVNLDVAEDSFQTKNEEKREGQDQMKRKRPILPEDINVNHSPTSKERQEILDVVNEYRDCFALGMEELGCTDVTKMDIKEVDGSKPVCLRPYKTTASEREAIREIVREWKDNGIVTETRSPYASPVLLVRKITGDHRLVVDYRRLNIQTVKDKFPLQRIDDLLEGLRNAKFFTTLDLAHGYLQIPLTDKAKLKTAFITPDDTGQFERMIFGLANAPAEFQRLMHTVLGPLLNKKAFCYLDDVIIPAKDWREMIERLREVLERIRSAKLTPKPSKCEFGRREVEFLGYVISTGGLKPGPRKIKAIEEFPEPKNVHDIRRFLGLTNFFRRFVKDFARKAEPLSRLTKKGSQFEWKEEQRRSFGGLRKDLVEYPVLAHYNPELKTEVHCDASAEGLAGMVLQMDEDGKWRLVYCVSKKTTEAEKMYHSSKLELMAIVWTLDRLRQFLVGIKFTVVTDCQALVYMNAKKTTNPQIARWYNLIQEYDFEIRHKPGEKMAHVDGMSRAPVDDPRDTMVEIVEKKLEVCLTITLEEQILMIQHSDPELRDLIQIFRKDPCDRTVGEQNRINDYSYKGGRLFRMVKNGEEERALYVIPKIPGGKQQGFLHPIKSGKRPFSIVHMDHVGPFVRSTKGNQELLVIVDNLTRFVRLSPVRNTSTQNVLKVMKSFVNDFGLPDKIISDRGSCFTSRQFEEFCRGNGIHHTLNSTKHPQGNGMVERVNRTVLSTIATSIEDPRRKDWDLKIKEVERDLNNAVNKTTNKTPFETLHGYSPRFHDGILRRLADEDVDPWTEPDRIQESVRTQIENKQEIMKTYYDKKKCRTIQFEVGEIVVMRHVPKTTEATLDRSNVYRWYKMFSEGREDANDEERAGRPSTSTTDEKINEVEKMILANRRITVREVAEDLNISIGSCHSIFMNDLGMRRVAAKFVPKLLNCDQKQHRMNIANEMLDSVRDDPNLLQRVITGDQAGVVHHEFLPQGRTVNKEYYLQAMRNLHEAIRQKRPDLWKNKNWLLHHDNAPAHTSLLVRDFLVKSYTLMMPQPPYSPDLAPCDFFWFPKLKRPMKGRRYATLDEIKTASKEELKKILKSDFLKGKFLNVEAIVPPAMADKMPVWFHRMASLEMLPLPKRHFPSCNIKLILTLREGTEPDDPNPTSLLSMGQQTAVSTQKCSDVCLENVGRRMSVFRVLSSEPPQSGSGMYTLQWRNPGS